MTAQFLPGSQVRVISGTFVGMVGEVLSLTQANELSDSVADLVRMPRSGPKFDSPGFVWVALTIFNLRTPIHLETRVVELIASAG
jgi:transcription antitermination factor NusG